MEPLDRSAIETALGRLPGWSLADDAITKSYRFDSFPDAIAFIDRIAVRAEDANHHPDLFNSYDRVDVSLTTHSAGGVSEADLDLARAIDEVVEP